MSLTVPALPIEKRYNVAPTQTAPVVRIKEGARRLDMLRWGLIPSWSKDIKIGYKLLNARAESLGEKPSFRSAYRSRRCLIPASGFYEWKQNEGSKIKQPYYITGSSTEILVFAGLWEEWRSPQGEVIESYTIITTDTNDLLKTLHNRMPVILKPEDFERWLNPNSTSQELCSLLAPCDSGYLKFYPVSTQVNSAKFQEAKCIERTG